jgi:ankyrin repeat protein
MDSIIRNDDLEAFKQVSINNIEQFYDKYVDCFHQSEQSLCLKYLLQLGLPIKNDHGTVLHDAVCYGNYDICDNFDINLLDQDGCSALFEFDSAYNDLHTKNILVQTLLKLGCNPNVRDKDGNTALHVLFMYNCGLSEFQNILQLFLNYGFDITIKNNDGQTIYDVIEEDYDKEWFTNIFSV